MKIIITESQYQDLTEKKLREFLYGFWDKQKKHVINLKKPTSEQPHATHSAFQQHRAAKY